MAAALTILCILEAFRFQRPTCINPPATTTDRNKIDLQYGSDHRYMSLDRRFDNLWEFDNTTVLLVPDPVLGAEVQVDAAISMFHQLHCLSSLRAALQKAGEGKPIGFDWHDDGHWPHCLDYLRKTILCFADGTLEMPPIVDGRRVFHIDGVHDVRRCNPSEPLFARQKEALQNINDEE